MDDSQSTRRAAATGLLTAITGQEPEAETQLTTLLRESLHALAVQRLEQDQGGHTLQPTALVHEAWQQLVDVERLGPAGSAAPHRHFVRLAAQALRQVLVRHVRDRRAPGRTGELRYLTLSEPGIEITCDHQLWLDLADAVEQLQARAPRLATVAELRMFGGLPLDEIAAILCVSPAVARDDWALARALIGRTLGPRAHATVPGSGPAVAPTVPR